MTDEAMREYQRRQADALRPSYDRLPEHIQDAVRQYIEHGRIPGDFLQAVICDRLMESYARADGINKPVLLDVIAAFWFNDAPGQSWGSQEKMKAWAAHRGLEGLES